MLQEPWPLRAVLRAAALGQGGGPPRKGGAAPDADECAHGGKWVGALQRAKNQHPVLGVPAPEDLRPPLLPSLQDFLSSLDDKKEGEAGFPTKAMTQRLKPHPGEGAPRTRGQHLQACLEEFGLSHMHPKAVGLSPGQEHVGMVPLPRAGATWPHITDYSLPPSPTVAHPRPATRKSQVTF